jgi:DNA invertase Pin-like site-specific DNA recombinase
VPGPADAVIYTRVSLDPRDTKKSVAEQEAECRAVAEREGYRVAHVFSDNDRSASRYARKTRPGYAAMLDYLRSGKADAVIAWESSRLTRDLGTYAALRDLCRTHDVVRIVGGKVLDPDDLGAGVHALMDEHASAETSKRVLRSVRANAAKGRPHGRLGYGYRRVYDPASRQLTAVVEHEDQAPILREVARRFLAGESFYAIARDLTERDVPAPHGAAKWYATNLRRLLGNPTYHGERVHNGEVVAAAVWPPIFDDPTWYQVKNRLADPERKPKREGAVRHLLSGVAKCGVCGARMNVGRNRGRRSYQCMSGFHTARREDLTDAVVVDIILARLNKPDVLELLADNDDAAVREAVAEAQDKRARLQTFVDAAADGSITAAALGRIETRLLGEIAAAEARARRAASTHALDQAIGINRPQWDALPMATKREVIGTLCEVVIQPAGRGHRTFDPRLIEFRWHTG